VLNDISSRLAEVRRRIDFAATSAGRDPSSVRLIAVSKTFPLDAIREAFAAGQRDFGENKVQEGLQKSSTSADLSIRWHLLGHLQTNKARKAVSAFAMIQSVDGVELLQKLDRAAEESGRAPELLIQVDLAGEATKFGAPPGEVPRLFEAAGACRAARVVGLIADGAEAHELVRETAIRQKVDGAPVARREVRRGRSHAVLRRVHPGRDGSPDRIGLGRTDRREIHPCGTVDLGVCLHAAASRRTGHLRPRARQ